MSQKLLTDASTLLLSNRFREDASCVYYYVTNEIDESPKEIKYTLAIDRAHVDLASRTLRPGRLFARLSHVQTGNTPTVQFWRQN